MKRLIMVIYMGYKLAGKHRGLVIYSLRMIAIYFSRQPQMMQLLFHQCYMNMNFAQDKQSIYPNQKFSSVLMSLN